MKDRILATILECPHKEEITPAVTLHNARNMTNPDKWIRIHSADELGHPSLEKIASHFGGQISCPSTLLENRLVYGAITEKHFYSYIK